MGRERDPPAPENVGGERGEGGSTVGGREAGKRGLERSHTCPPHNLRGSARLSCLTPLLLLLLLLRGGEKKGRTKDASRCGTLTTLPLPLAFLFLPLAL